jgi:hypothetical protein
MSTIELSDSESPAAAGPEDGRAADGPVTRLRVRVGTPRSESPAARGYHFKLTDACIVRVFVSGWPAPLRPGLARGWTRVSTSSLRVAGAAPSPRRSKNLKLNGTLTSVTAVWSLQETGQHTNLSSSSRPEIVVRTPRTSESPARTAGRPSPIRPAHSAQFCTILQLQAAFLPQLET